MYHCPKSRIPNQSPTVGAGAKSQVADEGKADVANGRLRALYFPYVPSFLA